MAIRCEPGDVAVILYDQPECLGNVGRLVKIHPTLQLNIELNLPCWLIEPMQEDPWYISESDGSITVKSVTIKDCIEHPDVWMLPIRDKTLSEDEIAIYTRIQGEIDLNLDEIGALHGNVPEGDDHV